MPAPTTSAAFVDLVRRSGVVEEKRLDAFLEKLRAASTMPPEPGKLAGLMVADGLLTHFQAQQIMQGKWKRFTIGKYKVLEQLGSGGMGSVYLCEHMLMRRRVAVKVLPTAKADDPAALERFYREARAVAALDHPNIVRAYDIDQSEKLHFLVMEYVDGASLQQIIKQSGGLDPVRAAHYIRQAALGLQHAHEQAGIVHRDIKPGNILVDRNGIVKVLDMGLARFFYDKDDNLTEKYDETTLGTADYLAPEQALNSHEVDIRADIYSLGATFYFCLTGRTPFAEGTVAQKLIWHQTRQPKPLAALRPDVDPGIAAIVDRMMSKDPKQRFQTPLEVVESLAAWTRFSIPPPPDTEMPQLSLAARGGSLNITESGSGPRPAPGQTTPSPKPAWQVMTAPPPSPSPSTKRSATPPAARQAPPSPPPAPAPLPSWPATPAVAPAAPAFPVVTASCPPAPSLLQASPVLQRPATAPEALPWEQDAPETDELRKRADTPSTSSRRHERHPAGSRTRRRLYWIIAAVGVLALAGIAYFLWQSYPRVAETSNPADPLRSGPTTWFAGPDEELRTLDAALRRARKGDTIVVRADVIRVPFAIDAHRARTLRGIRIIADEKRGRVIWKPVDRPNPDARLVSLEDAEDITIKGFDFDGEGKIKTLVSLLCGCKNVVLEDVRFRGYLETGVRFTNCMVKEPPSVTLGNAEFTGDTPPLTFEVLSMFPKYPRNDHIIIKGDCKFTGNITVKVIDLKGGDSAGVQLPAELKRAITLIPPPKK